MAESTGMLSWPVTLYRGVRLLLACPGGRERATPRMAFIAVLWVTGPLKLLGGFLDLALARPWGRALPRRVLLTAAWGGGILMALYGAAYWVQKGLMVAGVIPIPTSLAHTAAVWHVVLWDPWWLLGGVLFVMAAWASGRSVTSGGTATFMSSPGRSES